MVSFTPRPPYPRFPLDTRLVGPKAGLDAVAKEKRSLHMSGIELNELIWLLITSRTEVPTISPQSNCLLKKTKTVLAISKVLKTFVII